MPKEHVRAAIRVDEVVRVLNAAMARRHGTQLAKIQLALEGCSLFERNFGEDTHAGIRPRVRRQMP